MRNAKAVSVLVALALAVGVAGGQADARVKRVVRSNTASIGIPTSGSANPYPSSIEVNRRGRVKDVNVRLNGFYHTFPDDVDIMLVHNNRYQVILSDVGSDFDVSDLTITLDDEAAQRLPDSNLLTSGSFQPTDQGDADVFAAPAPAEGVALSEFDGAQSKGTWSLFVRDDTGNETGTITFGWTLELKIAT